MLSDTEAMAVARGRATVRFGGNNGAANAINNWGKVAGFAENSTPDPGCPAPQVLHFKPVVWEKGRVNQLHTLGGDPEVAWPYRPGH